MLTKSTGLETSIVDVLPERGIVMGYFSSFNKKDSDGDIIRGGAFKKTILENGPQGKDRIKHLWQHDRNQLIGKILLLKEDGKGLYFESQISKTLRGQEALTLYQERILTEHSFGFYIPKNGAKYDKDQDATIISEVIMKEGSAVTWGANEETPVVGIKSEVERLDRIKSLIKNGRGTDEMFSGLIEMKNEIEKLLLMKAELLEPVKETTPDTSLFDTSIEEEKAASELLSYIKTKLK